MTEASQFIWYDLMTPDLATATKFYGDVVGWKIADSGMPGMSYSILHAGDVMVGGLMQRSPEMGDALPGWQGHIYVPDVDDYAKRVTKGGGSIHRSPEDIPGIGRFAVVADPHGASFILFKPNSSEAPKKVPPNTSGHIGWRDLRAGDGKAAWDFYSELFGWEKSEALPMPGGGVYQMFTTGEPEMAGGMTTKSPDTPSPMWLYFFNVEAIDAAAQRVKKGGGKVVMEPMQVPGGQWIIEATDPHGNRFGLVAPKR
jgi:predicted enzyme related to lactoylglutathione lyase